MVETGAHSEDGDELEAEIEEGDGTDGPAEADGADGLVEEDTGWVSGGFVLLGFSLGFSLGVSS